MSYEIEDNWSKVFVRAEVSRDIENSIAVGARHRGVWNVAHISPQEARNFANYLLRLADEVEGIHATT